MPKKVSCPECGCVFFDELPTLGFKVPGVPEIAAYCTERKNSIDPQVFHDFYESKGWMIGKNRMKSWQAAVRTWERKGDNKQTVGGALCPLCNTYRLTGNAIVCASCGYACKRCYEQTAKLYIVKRRDGTKTAICGKCLDELRNPGGEGGA